MFKLIYSSLFLLFIMEAIQKYHVCLHYVSNLEALRTFSFMLLLVCLAALILTIIVKAVFRVLALTKIPQEEMISALEILCIAAFLLVYLYSLSLLLRSPVVLRYLWQYKIGPIVIILLFSLSLLKFKKQIIAIYHNILEAVWIPLLVLSMIAFIWTGSTFLTQNIIKKDEISDLVASIKHGSSYFHKPNIILIVFDALTAEDMSLYGYSRKTTPYLEEFAKESIVFENMHANYISTTPSLLSIFTSKYPWVHSVYSSGGGALKVREESITEVLKEYIFVSTVSPPYAQPIIIGIGARFEIDSNSTKSSHLKAMRNLDYFFYKISHNSIPVDELPVLSKIFPPRPQLEEMILSPIEKTRNQGDSTQITEIREYSFDPEKIFGDALKKMENTRPPFFHWIHIFPPNPHIAKPASVYPPRPFLYTFLPEDVEVPLDEEIWTNGPYPLSRQADVDKMRARYDESILYADSLFHNFLEQLKDKGLFDESIIIITSDHGESFEKGWRGHASESLFESSIHIPLIIHLPNQEIPVRVAALAEQVDIAPTILDLLGEPIPSWMEGESLLPYIKGELEESPKAKFSMSNYGNISIAVFKNIYKMIDMNGVRYFYNLKEDPEEAASISYEQSDKDVWMDIEAVLLENKRKIK